MDTTHNSARDYRDLVVWQKSMDLVVAVYDETSRFPDIERFGLASQMRRAAVSIPSNIAEGYRRGSTKEYRQFLLIAFGSASELGTQIEIVTRTRMASADRMVLCVQLLEEVCKMLNTMTRTLRQ